MIRVRTVCRDGTTRHRGKARALMRQADLGVVSLAPDVVRYAFPSKTQTYLAESLPLLVLCELDSELAEVTQSAGLGAVVAPGDGRPVRVLDDLYGDRAELERMRKQSEGLRPPHRLDRCRADRVERVNDSLSGRA